LDTVYASSVGILDFGAYWSPDTAGSAYTDLRWRSRYRAQCGHRLHRTAG
jgi:hypothetical protein